MDEGQAFLQCEAEAFHRSSHFLGFVGALFGGEGKLEHLHTTGGSIG